MADRGHFRGATSNYSFTAEEKRRNEEEKGAARRGKKIQARKAGKKTAAGGKEEVIINERIIITFTSLSPSFSQLGLTLRDYVRTRILIHSQRYKTRAIPNEKVIISGLEHIQRLLLVFDRAVRKDIDDNINYIIRILKKRKRFRVTNTMEGKGRTNGAVKYMTRLVREVRDFKKRNLNRAEALLKGLEGNIGEMKDVLGVDSSYVYVNSDVSTMTPPLTPNTPDASTSYPWERPIPKTVVTGGEAPIIVEMMNKVDSQFERLRTFLEEMDGFVKNVFVNVGDALATSQSTKIKAEDSFVSVDKNGKGKCPGCTIYDPTCAYYDFFDAMGRQPPIGVVKILHPEVDSLNEKENKPRKLPSILHTPSSRHYTPAGQPALNFPTPLKELEIIREEEEEYEVDPMAQSMILEKKESYDSMMLESMILPPKPNKRKTTAEPMFYDPAQPTLVPVNVQNGVPFGIPVEIRMRAESSDRDSGLDIDMADETLNVKGGHWDDVPHGKDIQPGSAASGYHSADELDDEMWDEDIWGPKPRDDDVNMVQSELDLDGFDMLDAEEVEPMQFWMEV